MNFYEKVYEAVCKIPPGRVTSYGQIALWCQNPRAARAVGYALRACKSAAVPCHRVLHKGGGLCKTFGPFGAEEQKVLLEAEGVAVLTGPDGYFVDMGRYGIGNAPLPNES